MTGLRKVMVSPEFVTAELTTGNEVRAFTVAQGLPAGSRLVAVELAYGERDLALVFENDAWEPSPNGDVERIDVVLRRV